MQKEPPCLARNKEGAAAQQVTFTVFFLKFKTQLQVPSFSLCLMTNHVLKMQMSFCAWKKVRFLLQQHHRIRSCFVLYRWLSQMSALLPIHAGTHHKECCLSWSMWPPTTQPCCSQRTWNKSHAHEGGQWRSQSCEVFVTLGPGVL